MPVGKPKEEALRTAHGVPTAPPPNQSSAWKADPAVKAPHVGSLPHFMGNSEEKCCLCPHVPLHCGDSHYFPTTWGLFRDYSHYYYFLGVWDAGVVGKPAPALGDGCSGCGEFFPSELRFLCLLWGCSELQTAAVWLWPPLGWFSSCWSCALFLTSTSSRCPANSPQSFSQRLQKSYSAASVLRCPLQIC